LALMMFEMANMKSPRKSALVWMNLAGFRPRDGGGAGLAVWQA
jgi:hypothetical protein